MLRVGKGWVHPWAEWHTFSLLLAFARVGDALFLPLHLSNHYLCFQKQLRGPPPSEGPPPPQPCWTR